MQIDKTKLKMGIWYEDKDGNRVPHDKDSVEWPDGAVTYHVQFPLEINEEIRMRYTNKDTCRHPLKYRKRTFGWISGVKGCECASCGKEKVGKAYIPFLFMPWEDGADTYEVMRGGTHIGSGDVILAMANSGDYTLNEAIIVYASACERCMNVLAHKYLNGADGYEEYSDEWKKCGTVCEFCEGE